VSTTGNPRDGKVGAENVFAVAASRHALIHNQSRHDFFRIRVAVGDVFARATYPMAEPGHPIPRAAVIAPCVPGRAAGSLVRHVHLRAEHEAVGEIEWWKRSDFL